MSFSNGSYNILYIKSGTDYLPVGCLTTNGFNENVEMIGTTTRDNTNGWGSGRPTKQSFNIPFSGLVSNEVDADGTTLTYRDVQALKRARTKIEWKIENTIDSTVDYGYGYITDLSNSSNMNEFITFDSNIEGWSEPNYETSYVYAFDVYDDVYE